MQVGFEVKVPVLPPHVSSLAFGGPKRDILYVTAGDKVFKRSMRHASRARERFISPAAHEG